MAKSKKLSPKPALNKPVVKSSNLCGRISEYIQKRNNKITLALQKESRCNHKWNEHGFGYQCAKCNFYTGLNQDLNKLIKKLGGR